MELDLKDYIKVIKKRILLIVIIVFISCLGTGIASYFFMEPIYQASTKLIVNSSKDPSGSLNQQLNINDINFHIRLIETYKEIIRTAAIMEKVAEEYEDLNLSAAQLINMVKVSSANNTQVMTLTVQHKSYDVAMNVVNAVSEVFQREIPLIMSVDNVSLLDRAVPLNNPSPVKPKPELNIAISFVISLMVGVGLAFLIEYMDDTIKTETDVHHYLGLPTLGVIVETTAEDLTPKKMIIKSKVGESNRATNNVT